MIKLHLKKSDPDGMKFRQELEDLCLAFETVTHPENSAEALPAIEESGKRYTSKEEIETWLNGLKSELSFQRSLSGDSCYIDPETGEVC